MKNSPSFAYETLMELKRDNPEDNFLWIMGLIPLMALNLVFL